jgi:predicted DsbA family dithiol-disulfide isomerase
MSVTRICACAVLLSAGVLACSGQDRAPPQAAGVDLARLTAAELNLYRTVLAEEISPCGGRQSLEQDLRSKQCPLSPLAARFIVYRIEQDDNRDEIGELYLARFGASTRPAIDVDDAPILGDKAAPVTLVEFSDFECPHCAAASTLLHDIVEESNGQVRLAFRNFPLPRNKGSGQAAIAGLAAQRQGKFWQLHDAMFEHRTNLDSEVILRLAEEVGLDVTQFEEDLLDPALEARLRSEFEEGERLGVHGTPTLFINGRLHDEPVSRLRLAIEEELARVQMHGRPLAQSEVNQPAAGASDGQGAPATEAPQPSTDGGEDGS